MATQKKPVHQIGTPAVKPDVVEDDAVESYSILDRFRESLTTSNEVEPDPYELTVPERPDIVLQFRVHNLDFDTYQQWMRRAEDKKHKEINWWNYAVIVISNLNVGIKLGNEVVHKDGDNWTVATNELHQFLGVPAGSTRQAIRALYKGKDGHAIQAAKLITEACGYSIDGDVREAGEDGPLDV